MDFVFLADNRVKIKEGEERDQYLDIAWELRKLLNMKATVIPFIIGALGVIPNSLIKGLEEMEIRGPDQVIITKKREPAKLWTLPSWQTTEWKPKKILKEKYSDLVKELKMQ